MASESALHHLQKQLAALPPRPSLAEVESAQQGIADVDSRLVERLEALLAQTSSGGANAEQFHNIQALKEEAARKTADAERLRLQAVLDLESQHQHYQRLISQAETALVSEINPKPRPSSGEPSGGQKLVSDEEARTDKLMQVIQRAWEEGAASLDLSEGFQGSLTWLPESLGHLTKLTDLNVSGQQLETVPDALAGLSNLRSLNLRSNKLAALPDSLGLLTSLTSLNVASNSLHDLPAALGNCSSLEELVLDFNSLPALPAALFQNLPHLRRLSVHLNKLRLLPASIGRLTALEDLDAHFNELQYVPESIGDCRRLRTLNLSSNFAFLGKVPHSIGGLAGLETLDLSNNQLQELPLAFGRLTNLKTLLLDGNPLKEPPSPIVTKGAQAVVHYLALRQHLADSPQGGDSTAYGWLNGWLGGVAGLGLVEWIQNLFGGVGRMLTSSTGSWLLGWTQTQGPRRIQETEQGMRLEEL